MINNVKYINY